MLAGGRRVTLRLPPARADGQVAIRSKVRPTAEPATVLGYVETQENGRRKKTDTPKDYTRQVDERVRAGRSRSRARSPIWSRRLSRKRSRRSSATASMSRSCARTSSSTSRFTGSTRSRRSPRRFEGHQTRRAGRHASRTKLGSIKAGTLLVRTAQPLGSLAVCLLEPRSEDGLATWNFFDEGLKEGGDFPVVRLAQPAPISLGPAEPLAEDRGPLRPITFDQGGGMRRGGGRFGGFFGRQEWLDGEHWLQVRDGRLMKVHAATGRSQPFVDAKALAKGLSRIPSLDADTAQSIAGSTSFDMDPAHRGFLFEHAQDLYYATFDLATAVRLTNQPGREQLPQFSPDGKAVAFVRDFDLYAVDIAEPEASTG